MDKKGIIALVICAIILMVYFPYIMPMISPPAPEQKSSEVEKNEPGNISTPITNNAPLSNTNITAAESGNENKSEDLGQIPLQDHIVLQNENIISVWTNEGASLKSVTLKNYKDSTKTKEMELFHSVLRDYYPLSITKLKLGQNGISEEVSLANRNFRVIGNSKNKVSFKTEFQNGFQITKNIAINPEDNHVSMEVIFANKSNQEITCEYQINAASGIVYEGEAKMDMQAVVGIDKANGNYKLIKTLTKDLPERNESVGISWAGAVNKYFAAVLKPISNDIIYSVDSNAINSGSNNEEAKEEVDFVVNVKTKPVSILPNSEQKHSYVFYLGPKIEKLLGEHNLESLLGFGMFKAISKILLKILNGFYTLIPNYGVSILLLTLLVKLMLSPLTRKSQMSMFRMQGLQPEVEKLKIKYKNDKQRLAKEQMELFKKNGANPLGGCLPMILQLPIFFALFRTLQLSFEMRQAPFMLWIGDLSMPDTLFVLPFSIPFLGSNLNILPLIMTVASFFQMKLNPKTPSADPQARMQQKMMSFMPLMFAFILYKMPSGLTLYWTVSTLFSIGENLVIRKSIQKLKKPMPSH